VANDLPSPQIHAELASVVRWEARRLSGGRHDLKADLIQCGWLGALEAAAKFEPRRGVKLSSYARYRIRGTMLDFLGRLPPATLQLDHDVPSSASQELMDAAAFRTDVATAFRTLPPSQQFIVAQVVVRERPLTDVARLCGQSKGNVRRELWTGLRILRVALDDYSHRLDPRQTT
jgi:RNA polymerase sigma factor (sigma-70 family)